MKQFSILLVLFSGCFALEGKTIIFPRQTDTDYVILKPIVKQPFKELTVCLRSYTEISHDHSLISIAIPGAGKDNALLIYPMPPRNISISINNEELYFNVDPEVLDWKHTCVAWDSETGLLQLWINGKRYPRRVTMTRSPIGPQMSIILGQEQDTFGGGFDAGQAFVGEIFDVNLWDYVLSPENMRAFPYNYYSMPGNIFSLKDGDHVVKGGAVVLKDEFISA